MGSTLKGKKIGTVRIGVQNYDIIETDDIRKIWDGQMNWGKRIIKVRPKPNHKQEDTILHEIVHALIWEHTFDEEKVNDEKMVAFITELLKSPKKYFEVKLKKGEYIWEDD